MSAAAILLAARYDPAQRPRALPVPPADRDAAYAVQRAVMATLGPIGGWKVGFSPATGQFTCAPLPAAAVMASPAVVHQAECPDRGVEAEIALRLSADLPPRPAPYTAAEVAAAVGSAHPAIELLQSRYRDVDAVDPLSALADSLSHYGLVWGAAIPGWQEIDLVAEAVAVEVDGQVVKSAVGNPAGAMLPMLAWLADTGAVWAGGLKAGQFVTTGSWTGKDFVAEGAAVCMRFAHCGIVEAHYA